MKMCDKNSMSQSDHVAATERGKRRVAVSHGWFGLTSDWLRAVQVLLAKHKTSHEPLD